MTQSPLSHDQLYRRCDPAGFDFETTNDLEDVEEILGQTRPLKAIRLATKIAQKGYNLFALGSPGIGKHSSVQTLLKDAASELDNPPDWVYLHNFSAPHKPKAMALPPGQGTRLYRAMQTLIEDIQTSVPAAFEGEDYRNRRQALDESAQEKEGKSFDALRQKAQEQSVALVRTPTGFALAPIADGAVMDPEVFNKLPQKDREAIEEKIASLQKELESIIKQIPRWAKEHQEAVRELNREITAFAVGHPIDELCQSFADLPEVIDHLDAVRSDLIENVRTILRMKHSNEHEELGSKALHGDHSNAFNHYAVNLIVAQSDGSGAPVVYENNPTMGNLVGRVEYGAQMGTLVTDFSMIKSGALHRANGGFLILDARSVLTEPFAWEALKRNLKAGRIKIESPGQMLSLVSTMSLEPEEIPLSVKVVLCGEPLIYYLLCAHDPQFSTLFKVAADFDDVMRRDDDAHQAYARLLATIARRNALKPLDPVAVARVVEHASRLAADTEKLSTRLEVIADLLKEADFYAAEAGADVIGRQHVQEAIDSQIHRADRLREHSIEAIQRNILLIATDGERQGQVNGLSVLELGGFAFGKPTRITARVRLGAGNLVDIEREVELGGPLHSKGVLILSGYLSARYALGRPFSLSASLVLEQSYGGVEGDSASSAELYALLSALAEVPIKQSLAVTGSVNQHGGIQAIGGVNEKIEGFFDICRGRGLSGKQGVLIPAANVQHLMLRQDVVEAAKAGQFSVYPVSTVEQGLELLTDLPAGIRGDDGTFPEGSLNRRVEDRLIGFADVRGNFGRNDGTEQK